MGSFASRGAPAKVAPGPSAQELEDARLKKKQEEETRQNSIHEMQDQETNLRTQKGRHDKKAAALKEKALAFLEDDEKAQGAQCMREAKQCELQSSRLDSQIASMVNAITLLQDQKNDKKTAEAMVAAAAEAKKNEAAMKALKMDDVHEVLYNGGQQRNAFQATLDIQVQNQEALEDEDDLVAEMEAMAAKKLQKQMNTLPSVPTRVAAPVPVQTAMPRQAVAMNENEDDEVEKLKAMLV